MRTNMEQRKSNLEQNKVLLGLSGGVDSTTAALLLKEKGYTVVGYFFDTAGNNEKGRMEAESVARQLGIEFISEDVSKQFNDFVVRNFCSEYLCGRTPNPCIVCNPNVKFKQLLKTADQIGAYYIATGHYARIYRDSCRNLFFVRQGINTKKDQSYMLYRLGQDVLSRLIFPLGEIEDKEKTRDLARTANLSNAEKRDSQEICFVPDDDYVAYMEALGYASVPGDYVDASGQVLGKHKGIIHYTLGQRKGLGIALGKPAFVIGIDPEKNQVVLGDNQDLFSHTVVSENHVFAACSTPEEIRQYDGKKVMAKIRYSAYPAVAVLHMDGEGRIATTFEEPQRAATPGQSIVFYDGDIVLGGGFIA